MIRRQVVLPVGPEPLWEALTDPHQTDGWFGGRVDWELREGAALRFRDEDGSDREGRIDAVRPGRYLRFRWWRVQPPGGEDPAGRIPGGGSSGGLAAGADASEVTYLIEPVEGGTRLTVQERQLTVERLTGAPPPAGMDRRVGSEHAPGPAWTTWDDRMVGVWVGFSALASAGGRA